MLFIGVVTVLAQPAYGAGQTCCWFWHVRGVDDVAHVPPVAAQFAHDAPPDPQLASRKPPSQAPCASQHPGHELAEHGGGGT
jgi:hypothetical protein